MLTFFSADISLLSTNNPTDSMERLINPLKGPEYSNPHRGVFRTVCFALHEMT